MVQATTLDYVPGYDSPVPPPHYNCVTMEESESEEMSANELYYILQTDMNSIKCHQEALKTEIASIKSQFTNLAENCGVETQTHSFFAGNPLCSTPLSRHAMKTPRRGHNYEDYLVQMMMDIPSSCLDESGSSTSPPQTVDKNHNTILVNDTVIPVPVTPDVVRSTRKPNQHRVPLHVRSIISNILNEQELRWRENKENRSTESSSTGYPNSSSSDANHVAEPIISPDREREIASRNKYYCDYAVERQSNVDSTRKRLNYSVSPDETYVPEDPLTRHVEGSESKTKTPRSRMCIQNNMNSSSAQKVTATPYHENIKVAHIVKTNRSSSAKRTLSGALRTSNKANIQAADSTTDSSYSTQSSNSSHRDHRKYKDCVNRRKVNISKHRCSSPVVNDTLAHIAKLPPQQYGDICSFYIEEMQSLGIMRNKLITSCDSFNDDGYKSQTLPRKGSILPQPSQIHSINSSSWPNVGQSFRTSTPTKKPKSHASVRLRCDGKSPSSDSNRQSHGVSTDKADSILTNSPKSVSSGGINAPCNSRNSPLNDQDKHLNSAPQSMDIRDISIIRPDTTVLQGISVIQPNNDTTTFKVPESLPPRRSTSRRRSSAVERCSTPIMRTSTPMPKIPRVHYSADKVTNSCKKLFSSSSSSSSGQTKSSSVLNKRSLIKKFKRFSENFYKVKAGKIQIETLANL